MAYYNSSNVSVFPSAYRKVDTKGKYTSEYNFVNIINSIIDVDSYVLSTDTTLANDHILRVVIHGYYFEIENFIKPTNKALYLAIRVENNTSNALVNFNNGSAAEDTALDQGSEFTGLYTGDTEPNTAAGEGYTIYTLQVCDFNGNLNNVRLSTDSIFFDNDKDSDLTGKINEKQNKLTTGNGLSLSNDSTIKIIDNYNRTLASAVGGEGSSTQPVYVNSSGQFTALSGASGATQTNESYGGISYKYTQAALITSGTLQQTGTSFYASTGNPPSGVGRNGDFWFKYIA